MSELNPADQTESLEASGAAASKAALWSYLDVLRRRIWIVVAITVIISTLGLIKAFRTPLIYRSNARLLVEQQVPSVMQFKGAGEGERWDPDFYRTQAELVTSRAVMEVALENSTISDLFAAGKEAEARRRLSSIPGELKRTVLAALGVTPPAPPATWELLGKQIIAEHLPNTHFIEVASQHTDPHRATLVANEVSRAYKEYHQRRQKELLGEAFGMLEKEKEKEELALLEAEEEMQAFRERAQTVSVSSSPQDQPAIERLVKLNEELTDVQLERIALGAQIGVMREALGNASLPLTAQAMDERLFSIPVIQTDAELSRTRRELADAEKSLAVLLETYGPSHPVLLGAQTNIVLLRSQFRKALEEIVSAHANRLQMLTNEEAELQSSYDDQRKVTLNLAKEEFELTRLQNKVERHRRLFDALVERMREVDVTSGLSRTNVQIVEEATLPTVPINASKIQTIAFSLVLGLFLGMGLAFLFENLDDTIKTPEDLKERSDLALLGFVPQITKETGLSASPDAESSRTTPKANVATRFWAHVTKEIRGQTHQALKEMIPKLDKEEPDASVEDRQHRGSIVLAEPISSVAEAYRSIRASLFYSSPADELKVVSITSCRPKEGKTTTSTNLAISIAQTGKRVLLIDGDLHRPSVHRTLGLDASRGLTNVLVGEMSWREALQQVERNGHRADTLDVLGAGPASPNPSELLGSTRMQTLIQEVRDAYDWVIVDTPPVLFVTDASILSVMCDGVIVVVRAGFSTNTLLSRATEKLRDVRAHMIGGILNNVVVSRVGRYYSTYYNVGYSRYAKDYHRSYYAGEEDRPVLATANAADPTEAAAPADPLEAARRQASAERARATQLEGERTRLQARLAELEAGTTAAQAEVAALRARLDDERRTRAPGGDALAVDLSPLREERDQARRDADSLRARLGARETDLAEWRRRLEDAQAASQGRERDLSTQAERLNHELESARTERNRLMEELHAERTRQLQAASGVQASTREVEQRLAAALQDADRLRRDGLDNEENARRATEDARRRTEEQRLRLEELTRQLAEERARGMQLETARALAAQEAERLTESLGREIRLRAEWQARGEAAEQTRQELLNRPPPPPPAVTRIAPSAAAPAPVTLAVQPPPPDPTAAPIPTLAPPPPPPPVVTASLPPPVEPVAPRHAEPDYSRNRNVRAALHQVDLHTTAGAFAQARPILERLVQTRPDQWDAWERLIPVLARLQDRDALEALAARFGGTEGRSHYLYALCYGYRAQLQGDARAAYVYFEQALKDEPRSVPALEALTRAALAQLDTTIVARCVDRLLRVDPNNAFAYYAKGSLDYVSGRHAQAEEALRRSLQLAKTPETLNDLALLLNERGNYSEAESLARAALDLQEHHQAWDTLASILIKAGRRDAARDALERSIELQPDNDQSLVTLTELHATSGDRQRAQELLERLAPRLGRLSTEQRRQLTSARDELELV